LKALGVVPTFALSNFGIDFSLLKSKLAGSFDYYIKTTSDILVKPPTLLVRGYGAMFKPVFLY